MNIITLLPKLQPELHADHLDKNLIMTASHNNKLNLFEIQENNFFFLPIIVLMSVFGHAISQVKYVFLNKITKVPVLDL